VQWRRRSRSFAGLRAQHVDRRRSNREPAGCAAAFLFAGEISGSRKWLLLFALRFNIFGLVILAAMVLGTHPIGLVIGLSLMVPAVIIEAWRARPAIDPMAPALDPEDPSWDLWDPWLARERDPDDEDRA
jgi:hypothetical protein